MNFYSCCIILKNGGIEMSKILILGNSGSGKSTFTSQLASKLQIDFLHLDTLIYKHDWKKPEYEEMEKQIELFLTKENWIIDGNFLKKAPSRFYQCDTVYFLDINRFTCFFSVIFRYFKYKGKHRDSRSDLCDEKITKDYLKWVFLDYYKTSRKTIIEFLKNNPDKKIFIFKTRQQIKKYLKEVQS